MITMYKKKEKESEDELSRHYREKSESGFVLLNPHSHHLYNFYFKFDI